LVAVTSALAEEGKSTVAAWYAYANAIAGRRTLLVDCDFRRPVLADRFGLSRAPGLSEFMAGEAEPQKVLRLVPVHGRGANHMLAVIPAGGSTYQPSEMIASSKFRDFVEEVKSAYDLVVFDSAPLLPVSDALELIPQVDGVLFCVRLGQTTRDQARAGHQAILHLPRKPIGLVLTGVRPRSSDDYYQYYSHTPNDTLTGTRPS
jgi:capsular exopolysaccharide synthesis family protein